MADQQYLRIGYGNEDKFEDTDLMRFESSKEVADYLRMVADRIEKYPNSKSYRNSDVEVLRQDKSPLI